MSAQRADAGFSLVSVVVSLTMLSVGLLGLAGISAAAAQRARGIGHLNIVAQTLTQQVNRIGALPYDSLMLGVSCRPMESNGFAYTRCVRVDSIQPRVKRVTLAITPANPSHRPVMEVFQRSQSIIGNPLGR